MEERGGLAEADRVGAGISRFCDAEGEVGEGGLPGGVALEEVRVEVDGVLAVGYFIEKRGGAIKGCVGGLGDPSAGLLVTYKT